MMARLILAVVILAVMVPRAEAAQQTSPPGATSCSGCHAANRSVETPVPRLVGPNRADIEAAMAAFRAGQRPAAVMDRIARGFTDDEVKAIAAWYGAQKD
jgi:sulfide dehydrogenase cytochrome subunit